MANKNFTNNDKETINAFLGKGTPAAKDSKGATKAKGAKSTKAVKATKDQEKEELTYKFNARFTEREKNYLQEKMWRERTNITHILVDLVEADMKKHPEILRAIDELND